jgi:septum formation protein
VIPLILASRSPRRIELLRRGAVAFEAIEAPIDDAAEAPPGVVHENAIRIARLKARAVREAFPARCEGRAVLAADTICEMGGHAVGKPRDVAEARAMLASAMGREHRVVTGVCILRGEREWSFFDEAFVTIEPVSEAKLDEYLAGGQWKNRAGGYDYEQRLAEGWRLRCRGDPDTVAGLPWTRARMILEAAAKEPP